MTPNFPALAFCRDISPGADPGQEVVTCFLSPEDFATCTTRELKRGKRQGLTLVDRDLETWQVTSIIDLGPYGSRLSRAIRFLVRQSVRRIDQKLVHLGPTPLEALKTRVAETILATPDYWRDDEAIAGEDGPPIEEQVLLDEIVSTVHAASSVLEIINGLFGESFEA